MTHEEKAKKHEAEAARHFQDESDSFDRCDTDGCVSQFASNLSGRLESAKADIARRGGVWDFQGLFDAETGERVHARQVSVYNKYKYDYEMKWVLTDEAADKYGRKWIPAGLRSSVQKNLGLCEREETAPAAAKISGSGHGFSGLATCYIDIFRTDGGYPGAKKNKEAA